MELDPAFRTARDGCVRFAVRPRGAQFDGRIVRFMARARHA
jgi:hypothetical protein